MGIVVTFIKIFRRMANRRYKWKPLITNEIELGNSASPKVLVQIPTFNEREVYKILIGACCDLSWPTENFIIQVLDDTLNPSVKLSTEQLASEYLVLSEARLNNLAVSFNSKMACNFENLEIFRGFECSVNLTLEGGT